MTLFLLSIIPVSFVIVTLVMIPVPSLRPASDEIRFPGLVDFLLFVVTVLSFLQVLHSGLPGRLSEQNEQRSQMIRYSLNTIERFCQSHGNNDLPGTCAEIRAFWDTLKDDKVSSGTQLDAATKLISQIEDLRYDEEGHRASPDLVYAVKSSLIARLRDFRDGLESTESASYLAIIAFNAFVALILGVRLALFGYPLFPLLERRLELCNRSERAWLRIKQAWLRIKQAWLRIFRR
ncbi:MAG: hypothetical protein JJ871_16380 [Thalassospira sp.]|uniref:hypothetical protein n=1 Tax=Thalassospira sp. TaxID=1912094 RepID=UPI001B0F3E68|nr:hypothetical protein [Thalassospira sp.]MBO6579891.1 hypothetical protein [Thalassospira sp.]MBO6820668.1 hypothetical protein [Thalassospira sp.]MBO6889622.1 hypothetical protein [Thalassospira sp.]